MEDLKALIKQQRAYGDQISRIIPNLKKKGAANITPQAVQSRLELTHQLWNSFYSVHYDKLVAQTVETEKYFSENFYAVVQDTYMDTCESLQKYLSIPTNPTPPQIVPPVEHLTPQLPRISLPTFSGDYADWESFSDLFSAMVAKDERISKATKLQYLKLSLKGEAANLLKNVEVTDANFDKTWKSLTERYTNKRVLLHRHLTRIYELPTSSKESASELRALLDNTQDILRALENLGRPVGTWDDWVIFHLLQRIDRTTHHHWETYLTDSNDIPTLQKFFAFLNGRIRALEMINAPMSKCTKPPSTPAPRPGARTFHVATTTPPQASKTCVLCNGAHYITVCSDFTSKSVSDRQAVVKRLQLCYNCLGLHPVRDCKSNKTCRSCHRRHNTLLHTDSERSVPSSTSPQPAVPTEVKPIQSFMAGSATTRRAVLLATAKVLVNGPSEEAVQVRALLDPGSETSFVTESLAQLLQLSRRRTWIPLSGLGATDAGIAKHCAHLTLRSTEESSLTLDMEVYVLPRLTNLLPSREIRQLDISSLQGLTLADPTFLQPERVEMIIGADIYPQILRDGILHLSQNQLLAQNTAFGWVISGIADIPHLQQATSTRVTSLHCASDLNLISTLQRFWETEEVPTVPCISQEDEVCETHLNLLIHVVQTADI